MDCHAFSRDPSRNFWEEEYRLTAKGMAGHPLPCVQLAFNRCFQTLESGLHTRGHGVGSPGNLGHGVSGVGQDWRFE